MINLLVLSVIAYFLGSIPFSFIIAKLRGVDLTKVGSKNVGATNVYRNLGLLWAVLAFTGDVGKGYLAVWLTSQVTGNQPWMVVISGLLVILGHMYSPFLKFKGGKGVATGVGILIFIQPLVAIIGFIFELILIWRMRIVSLSSILAALLVAILLYTPWFQVDFIYQGLVTCIVAYIILKHRSNIIRLVQRKENKI